MRITPALNPPIPPTAAHRWASGVLSLDTALAGGMPYGNIHEIYAAEVADASAAMGFGAVVVSGMVDTGQSVAWLRTRRSAGMSGLLQANGWMELGGAPGHVLLAIVPDAMALLRAAVDALRCAALGAVVVEGWGAMRELDLTASRRLALAAEKSGVPLFVLRIDAEPVPSAAQTRWQVQSAPSRALPGNAPGYPTFDVTLLRQRGGPCGLNWRLEWNRDRRKFQEAAISGAVVSVPAGGPAAGRAGEHGRHAA